MEKKIFYIAAFLLPFSIPVTVQAMHISEGFLPPQWCAFYFVLTAPFFYLGLRDIKKKTARNKDIKMLLALVAAYSFVLSAMKIPSVTGSSSHPTGTGLGAILFGPFVMSVLGVIILIFQAVFLAHGGITTLGANAFSMAVAGPIVSYIIFKAFVKRNKKTAVFLSAFLGDLTTYLITSIQLSAAFPSKNGGVFISFIKFVSIFAITQIPLAIIEGILTVIIFEFIEKHSIEELEALKGVN
jgi:cobalt/nickel transport system permease protein